MTGSQKAGPSKTILNVIARVRRRWRMKLLLRGLATTFAGVLITFLVSSWGLEFLRFQSSAVSVFRAILWIVIALFVGYTVLWPLLRPISDERVALYLEEQEPSLQSRVLAAVETSKNGDIAATPLVRELIERATRRCRDIENGDGIERKSIRRSSGLLGGLTMASVIMIFLGPGFLRHGAGALFLPGRSAEAVNPYSVSLEPGDTTIARNSDLLISAELRGFDSEDVVLFVRRGDDSQYQPLMMISDGSGRFDALLLSVGEPTQYYVQSNGVRSATFTLDVADLPAVDQLAMEYRFPAYTGLAPRQFEYGGDVAALAGTEVTITVTPTLASPGGQIIMDTGDTISMVLDGEGNFTGSFSVRRDGFYGIKLQTLNGSWVSGAPDYQIDVLTDQPPSISFNKPGRDSQASPIEEVFIEARADDDFGVGQLLLIYSVNGGPNDTTVMYTGRNNALAEVTAGHTLFMEEYELEPGDLISYYGVVRDNGPAKAEALSDIYFLQIRPFRRDFREAPEQGGGGGEGGEEGGMEDDLSKIQRSVIAATFNLVRDKDSYNAGVWDENVVSVALSQQRLREQVETLRERMINRGITGADEAFKRISEVLPEAVEAMEEAETLLREGDPQGAIPAEQRSLRALQKAEETYERFVSQGPQPGGGGGAGGGAPDAEDLADLFELELDKLNNQYETVERSQQESADQQVDEALEKLRELARRQEQELERQQRRAAAQGGQGGTGGQSARDLAEEAEETARQLERLARETGDQRLQEVARNLQQSADAMRRSATGGTGGVAEAQSALRRLRSARDELKDEQDDRTERDLEDARERAASLARDEASVRNRLQAMKDAGKASPDQIGRINETKAAMAEEVEAIKNQIDQMTQNTRRDGRDGVEELEAAGQTIRETQLQELLLWSRGFVGRRDQQEYGEAVESQIAQAIQSLQNRLEEAAAATGEAAGDVGEEALESAQDLVRSLESLDRRLRDPGEGGNEEAGDGQGQSEIRGGGQGQGEGQGQGQGQGEGQGEGQGQSAGQGEGEGGGQGGAQGQGQEGQRGQSQQGPGNPGGGQFGGDPSMDRGTRQGFSADEIRQFRREFRERLGETQSLGEILGEAGVDTAELNEIVRAMRALAEGRTYDDPEEVARLQEAIVEGMKQLEFKIRRELTQTDSDQILSGGSQEVPEGFKDLVEEYYRALSRGNNRNRQ